MKPYKVRRSKIDNLGLYAAKDIKSGSKIIEYNSILFEADGISLRLAIIAVNNITNRAEPNCFHNFVSNINDFFVFNIFIKY